MFSTGLVGEIGSWDYLVEDLVVVTVKMMGFGGRDSSTVVRVPAHTPGGRGFISRCVLINLFPYTSLPTFLHFN